MTLIAVGPLKARISPHCPDQPHLGPPLTPSALHLSAGLGSCCPPPQPTPCCRCPCPRPFQGLLSCLPLGRELWGPSTDLGPTLRPPAPGGWSQPAVRRHRPAPGPSPVPSGAALGPRCRSPPSLPPLHSNGGGGGGEAMVMVPLPPAAPRAERGNGAAGGAGERVGGGGQRAKAPGLLSGTATPRPPHGARGRRGAELWRLRGCCGVLSPHRLRWRKP